MCDLLAHTKTCNTTPPAWVGCASSAYHQWTPGQESVSPGNRKHKISSPVSAKKTAIGSLPRHNTHPLSPKVQCCCGAIDEWIRLRKKQPSLQGNARHPTPTLKFGVRGCCILHTPYPPRWLFFSQTPVPQATCFSATKGIHQTCMSSPRARARALVPVGPCSKAGS